ncbi:hypothetical protein [Caldisericum exile]|uniref:hypothetical protein n=1 Tax=Caldisericum exile TaxID=693075 RepID=UPI003C72996B
MKKVIKKVIKKALEHFKRILERVVEIECAVTRCWVSSSHRRLMAIQWSIPPQPEFFDHHIDLFYQWLASRNPLWLERGVFNSLTLKGGEGMC